MDSLRLTSLNGDHGLELAKLRALITTLFCGYLKFVSTESSGDTLLTLRSEPSLTFLEIP